uniref:Uncharacterized protein n=1 Tax=Candidatus Kentrum sp. DK TaxID=2126562 RepID=A0A450T0G3_9GAMM|nr:MAG: hypothetical protein BECKDK2373B_GA0170837_10885 [Candidatus Kentron sp. DK]
MRYDSVALDKMPLRGKKAALESGAPSGAFPNAPLRKFGNFVFPIRGQIAFGPTNRDRYNAVQQEPYAIPPQQLTQSRECFGLPEETGTAQFTISRLMPSLPRGYVI